MSSDAARHAEIAGDRTAGRLIAIFAALVLFFAATGMGGYLYLRHAIKADAQANLGAIAELKARQIQDWIEEKKASATTLATSAFLLEALQKDFAAASLRPAVNDRIDFLRDLFHFSSVLVLDERGHVLLRSGEQDVPDDWAFIRSASGEPGTHLYDLQMERGAAGEARIEMGLFARLALARPAPPLILYVGVAPSAFLFPLIQKWPTPSESAETLLVRREGGQAVFLNQLRHRPGTALRLRFPVDSPELPAARVLKGSEGLFEGVDYRGVPVLAYLKRIGGTPWAMVSKVDSAEAYAALNQAAAAMVGLTGTFILGAGLYLRLWWRSRVQTELAMRYRDDLERRALEQHFDYLSKYANDAIFLADEHRRVVEVNDRCLDIYGYSREELITMQLDDLREGKEKARLAPLWPHICHRKALVFESVHQRKDGSTFPVESSVRVIEQGGRVFYQDIVRDISERKQAEEALRRAKEDHESNLARCEAIIDSMSEALVIADLDGTIVTLNDAALRLHGFRSELEGRMSLPQYAARFEVSDLDGRPQALEHWPMARVLRGEAFTNHEVRVRRRDAGSEFVGSYSGTPVRDVGGAVVLGVITIRDVTEQKRVEEHVRHLAYYDALTDLPNRALLRERLGSALAHAERYQTGLAVMVLDLDHFKNINDSLGHPVGDGLLREVAARLSRCIREQDTAARPGGDEFMLVLPDTKWEGAAHVAEKIVRRLAERLSVNGYELNISCSLGISLYPDNGRDRDILIERADAAMYRAKQRGRNNYQFFTEEMHRQAIRVITLQQRLRKALDREEFVLHYQPQVNVIDGRMTALEALLRWPHPEGMVSPSEFIPLAEDSGLIVDIGLWVLREAAGQVKHWEREGMPAVPVAVNLSAVQFRQKGLSEMIGTVLRELDLPPQLLELEITETSAMEDTERSLDTLHALHDLGVRISIDDFGTGYSSLNYLKRFPVQKLKIDQSFVRNVAVAPEDGAIVDTIVGLANSLNFEVIAEGVETSVQLQKIREKGCHHAQGFYFSHPLPPDRLGDAFAWGRPR